MPVVTETADAAAGTSTAYSMAVGDYFYGNLSLNDDDWVAVTLQAGQTYTLGLTGIGALSDGVTDTVVSLYSSTGSLLASDDDDGPGLFSNLTYTINTTGTYYVRATAWNPSAESGDYGLSVTPGTKASYDVAMGAGVLLRPDASWAGSPGTSVTVTWGIRTTGPGGTAYDASGNPTPYIVPSAAQIAAAQDVMAMFDGISGLSFTQVNPGGTTDSATMLFGAYSSGSDGAGAFAYYPGSTAPTANAGDVWLNNNSVSQSSLPTGSFSHFAMMHEVGHAIGLAHPGDYNAAPGVSITYANNAQFIEDTHQYTVMSYFDESNTTTSFSSYPDTLLLYDIYALHQQHGADYSYHAGNTTYGFNATVGGAYDFTTNTDPVLSIWDGSGTDTLDLSGYAMAQSVNLGEGQFSDIGGFTGNLSIAIGAVIENAIGGSGNDRITGNAADNSIDGGGATDIFVVGVNRASATITASGAGYVIVSAQGTDSLTGIEYVEFLDQTVDLSTVTGTDIPGDLTTTATLSPGGSTASAIDAGGDQDWFAISLVAGYIYTFQQSATAGSALDSSLELLDGAGNPLASGNDVDGLDAQITFTIATSGTYYLAAGGGAASVGGYSLAASIGTLLSGTTVFDDVLSGTPGNDIIDLLAGDDSYDAGAGDDTVLGGGGDDTLVGGDGADRLYGQGGFDIASYADETLGVGVRLDGIAAWGGATGDVLVDIEGLIGSGFRDTLVGNDDDNLLQGRGGDDTLWALGGNDALIGGDGADRLYGQGGSDRFIFADGFGTDTILDFDATDADEQIDLSALSTIASYTALTGNSHMSQQGADVVIDDFAGNTITLASVQLGDLDSTDFLF